jgi:hypothetical protein
MLNLDIFSETKQDRICRAIIEQKILKFYYKGTERVVEPYICGIDGREREILLGYQLEERDFPVRNWGWRLFNLSEMSYLGVTRNEFNTVRTTVSPFNPLDLRMKDVYCMVELAKSPVERVPMDRAA